MIDTQTDRQTDKHTHTHTDAGNDNTRRPKLASGKNDKQWHLFQPDSTQIRSLSRGKTKTLIGLVITRVASRHKEVQDYVYARKEYMGTRQKAHHLRPEDIANKIQRCDFITRYYDICKCSV